MTGFSNMVLPPEAVDALKTAFQGTLPAPPPVAESAPPVPAPQEPLPPTPVAPQSGTTPAPVAPAAQPTATQAAPLPAPEGVSPQVTPAPDTLRPDGSQKGKGYLGVLPITNPDGSTGTTSEYTTQSDAVKVNGQRIDFPTLVPTLTPEEVDLMTKDIIPNKKPIPEAVMQKAIAYANQRLREGKSVFADEAAAPEQAAPAVQKLDVKDMISPELYQKLESEAQGGGSSLSEAISMAAMAMADPKQYAQLKDSKDRRVESARSLLAQLSTGANVYNREVLRQQQDQDAVELHGIQQQELEAQKVLRKAGITPPTPPADLAGKRAWINEWGSKAGELLHAEEQGKNIVKAKAMVFTQFETEAKNGSLAGDVRQQFRDRMLAAGVPEADVMKQMAAEEDRLAALAIRAEEDRQLKRSVANASMSVANRTADLAEQRLELARKSKSAEALAASEAGETKLVQTLDILQGQIANAAALGADKESIASMIATQNQVSLRLANLSMDNAELRVALAQPLLDLAVDAPVVHAAYGAALDNIAGIVAQNPAWLRAVQVYAGAAQGLGGPSEGVVSAATLDNYMRANPDSLITKAFKKDAASRLSAGMTEDQKRKAIDALARVPRTP